MDIEEKKDLKRTLAASLLAIAIFILLSILMAGCRFKDYKFNEDSLAEEILEEIIEHKTGLDIDLTPNSHEDEVEVPLGLSPFDLVLSHTAPL